MREQEIDQKYIDQANALEAEFFDIVLEVVDGTIVGQHRELKSGRSLDKFNHLHAEIWRNHERELIDNDFLEPLSKPEPPRNLEAEFDELKARVGKLESEKAATK